MTIPFLPVDFVILAVLGLSGFFAAYRGFVNELLSILGWGLAAIITAVLFGTIKPTVRAMIEPDWFADAVGFVGLFLAVIIPISFVAFRVGEAARQSSIGPLDRSLGFVYGVVRGLVIAALAFIIFDTLSPKKPDWIADAKLIPIVERSGDVLRSLVNSKPPKGVPVSADPHKITHAPSQPRWSDPVPEQQSAALEQPKPQPQRTVTAPQTRPAAPETPPPPASEVGGLAPFLSPAPTQPNSRAAEPAKPKPQPKPGSHSQPAANGEQALSAKTSRPTAKTAKAPEKTKPKAKAAKPDAKLAAKKPKETRAPKNQLAATERRSSPKAQEDKSKTKGYGARDRQALDQLVRSTTREP